MKNTIAIQLPLRSTFSSQHNFSCWKISKERELFQRLWQKSKILATHFICSWFQYARGNKGAGIYLNNPQRAGAVWMDVWMAQLQRGAETLVIVTDPCEDKYCGSGRECQASEDGRVGVCVCSRRCARRHRPVCGSDGNVYANHCELHRAACNLGSPLTASRLMRCLHRGKFVITPPTFVCLFQVWSCIIFKPDIILMKMCLMPQP